MDKYIDFFYGDNNSEVLTLVHPGTLEKRAELSSELLDYIKHLAPKPGYTYALVNALSAGEAFGCFFKNEQVWTKDSVKNIQDIKIGDEVITHNGNIKKVINTFKTPYEGYKLKLKIQNLPEYQESTPEHPFMVLRKELVDEVRIKYYKQKIDRKQFLQELSLLPYEFIKGESINPGDYVYGMYNMPTDSKEQLSLDLAYIYGYYLSEGCLAKRYDRERYNDYEKIIFVMSENDLDMVYKLENVIKNYNHVVTIHNTKSSKKTIRLEVSWKELASNLYNILGHHSKNKFISPIIFNQSREWILTFIAAYLDGDGCITHSENRYNNTIKFSTVSKNLAISMQRLLAKIGIVSSISLGYNLKRNNCFGKDDNKIYEISIGSSFVKEILDKSLRLKGNDLIDKQCSNNGGFYILPNGYILYAVKKVIKEETLEDFKYNFEVEDDNSYYTNILGHNCNRNGDYFPEIALKEYHKTFEALGHVFKHHLNKDPNKSLGKVIFSHYNDKMKRVEIVIELINEKAKDVIEKLEAGGLPATSMGARVPYDECSICHKRAKNRGEYCEHLLTQMNKVLPDGRKVYAINRHPKFFDISIVVVPAEKTSGFLKVFNDFKNNLEKNEEKFASYVEDAYTKIAELDSFAEIKKQVPGEDVVVSKNPKELANLMRHANSKLSENVLCKLSEFPFTETLSTMLGLRILPSKADFQKLALLSFGLEKEAKELEANNIIFEPNTINIDTDISLDHFNTKIAEVLQPEVANLALTKELIIARELVKKAEEWQPPQPPPERSMISRVLFGNEPDPKLTPHKNPIIPLSIIGSLYYGYAKSFNDPSKATFRSFIGKNPWLMPVLVAGATGASILTQDAIFTKTAGSIDKFVRNSLITFPTSYIIAGKYENDAQQGQPISKMQNLVRKHPALTAILGSLAGVKAENSIRKLASFVGQLPENIKEDVYKTLMEE